MQKLVTTGSFLIFGALVIAVLTLTIASGRAANPSFDTTKEVVKPSYCQKLVTQVSGGAFG